MSDRVLVIEARYYDEINDLMLDGAKEVLDEVGADFDVVTVPGALEIPAALNFALKGKTAYDAYIVIGCVIRGETTHYDIVCNESMRGLYDIAHANDLALGNAILTVENRDQALARAYKSKKNKGGEAARAALALLALKRDFQNA